MDFGKIGSFDPFGAAFNTVLSPIAKANQQSSTAGQLWEGTPISDMLVGQAHASEGMTYDPNNADYSLLSSNIQLGGSSSPTSRDGSGGSGSGGTPTGGDPGGGGPDPIAQEIENAYNARIGALGNVENTLRSQQPGIEQDVRSQFETSQSALDTQRGQGLRQIDQQEDQGEQRRDDALNAARRLYNELMMGGQQRFGGASSAGEAYAALGGRELQRNQADTQQNFQNFMQQVEGARQTLNERYQTGLQQLEMQKNQAMNQVRRDFQNKLAEINNQRSAAQEDKANARLSALQDMRNQIFSIENAMAEQRGTLDQAKQQAEQQIQQFTQTAGQQAGQAQQAAQGFGSETSTNPQSNLAFGNTGQGGDQGQQFQGVRSRDDEEERNSLFA